MNHFGVIGIDKERADRIQKLEEQEDFMIMMAERKNSKALNFDKTVITPFLTWQVCSAPPPSSTSDPVAGALLRSRVCCVCDTGHEPAAGPATEEGGAGAERGAAAGVERGRLSHLTTPDDRLLAVVWQHDRCALARRIVVCS